MWPSGGGKSTNSVWSQHAQNSLRISAVNISKIPQEWQIDDVSSVSLNNESTGDIFDRDQHLQLLTWRRPRICIGAVNIIPRTYTFQCNAAFAHKCEKTKAKWTVKPRVIQDSFFKLDRCLLKSNHDGWNKNNNNNNHNNNKNHNHDIYKQCTLK